MSGGGLEIVVEMHRFTWQRFQAALAGVSAEEVDWHPLPQANNINVIVRHLRIEAEWHVACLERGETMPIAPSPERQRKIDAVPLDFAENLRVLESSYQRFLDLLENTNPETLHDRSVAAYREWTGEAPPHLLGFHQAAHLASHLGQIRSIRNLFRTTRGEQAKFFPDNPSYPKRR